MIGYISLVCVGQVYGTWPVYGGTPTHEAVQLMRGAITSPVIKWRVATGGWVEVQFSAIADVDEDGAAEVLIASLDRNLYCLRGSDGTEKWRFVTGGEIYPCPAVADVDGDGDIEVVIGSGDHNVYCLRGSDGTKIWEFATRRDVNSAPVIADVDRDGALEVVIGSHDSSVYCLRATDGTQKWAFTAGHLVQSSPAVADLDGDGDIEIVVGSWDYKVYCLRGTDGTKKWEFATGNWIWENASVADVDRDGYMEVVIGSDDGKIYCLRGSDGTQKWNFATGGAVRAGPAIADVEGDGGIEIIMGSLDKKVYCLRGSDGVQKWSAGPFPALVHLGGALVDVDGDGRLEYTVSQIGVHPDTFYCLHADDGSLLWKIALAYDVHNPFPGDIDNDGCIELITGTLEPDAQGYRIFAIDDPLNATGCGPFYEGIKEDLGGGLVFRPHVNGIYLLLPKDAQVSLCLYDPSGKLIQRLYDGLLSQGGHTFIPKTEARGVYLAVLRYQGGTKTLKIVR
ncbi:MAG: FG-GAP-like repeat-containing protein [candidate division WOR-3 bacterium]